jgi:hypothetical protein
MRPSGTANTLIRPLCRLLSSPALALILRQAEAFTSSKAVIRQPCRSFIDKQVISSDAICLFPLIGLRLLELAEAKALEAMPTVRNYRSGLSADKISSRPQNFIIEVYSNRKVSQNSPAHLGKSWKCAPIAHGITRVSTVDGFAVVAPIVRPLEIRPNRPNICRPERRVKGRRGSKPTPQ